MTAPANNRQGPRRRKAHQKSRCGCGNCKLRRVKCDETRPRCRKCTAFGVSCNYDDPHAPDLQLAYTGVAIGTPIKKLPQHSAYFAEPSFFASEVKIPDPLSPEMTRLADDGYSRIRIDSESLGRLNRFLHRTVHTVGPPSAGSMFQKEMMDLVCDHPYLMHMVQALTALHDRLLSPTPDTHQTPVELYHAAQAASLFNAKLSVPLKADEYDPIWATAALLGIAAICWMEAGSVEEAWPLTQPRSTDLDWIRMSKSKGLVWDMTNPLREGGRFRSMALNQRRSQEAAKFAKAARIEELPSELVRLCEIDEKSTIHTNPYLGALQGLAQAMAVETTRNNMLVLLRFIWYISPEFEQLLKKRDARALLLMAHWYAKVRETVWWMERRSMLECQAICLYLERHHAEDTEILELLTFPKMRCGLLD